MESFSLLRKGKCKDTGVWPPLKMPQESDLLETFRPLIRILHCRSFHGILYTVLYRVLKEVSKVSEQALCLTIFILELGLSLPFEENETSKSERRTVVDSQFSTWFAGDSLIGNMAQRIDRILCFQYTPGLTRAIEDETDLPIFPDLYRMQLRGKSDSVGADLTLSLRSDGPSALPYIDSTPESETALVPADFAHMDANLAKVLASLPPALRRECLTCVPKLALEGATDEQTGHTDVTMASAEESAVAMEVDGVQTTNQNVTESQPIVTEGSEASDEERSSDSSGEEDTAQKSLTGPGRKKALPSSRPGPKALPSPEVYIEETDGESMVSMLMKLYRKFNGEQVFKPEESRNKKNGRVGTAEFYIGNLLNKAYFAPKEDCKLEIDRILTELERRDREKSTEKEQKEDSKETRKKLARERQQRLMAQFMSKQKHVMEQLIQQEGETTATEGKDEDLGEGLKIEEIEIEESVEETEMQCVICSQNSTASLDAPIGLVASCQATSVLGKEMPEGGNCVEMMSVAPEGEIMVNRGYLSRKYVSHLADIFDNVSALHSVNIGWEGGVRVRTCGHYIHTDCHKSYMEALQNDRTQILVLQVDKGEFFCPLCRQLSNQVLPVLPKASQQKLAKKSSEKKSWSQLVQDVSGKLADFDKEQIYEKGTRMEEAMTSFVDSCKNSTFPMFSRPLDPLETAEDQIVMIKSILRTNLETDLMLKKFQLDDMERSQKSCIAELLMAVCDAVRRREASETVGQLLWSEVTGQSSSSRVATGHLMDPEHQEVVTVLRDPSALLIHLVCLLCPVGKWNEDFKIAFQTMCQCLLNLQFVKSCLQYIAFVPQAQLKVWEDWIEKDIDEKAVWRSQCPQMTLAWLTRQWNEANIDWEEVLGAHKEKPREPELRWFFWKKELENCCLEFLQLAVLFQNCMTGNTDKQISSDFDELYKEITNCIAEENSENSVSSFLRWPQGDAWVAGTWMRQLLSLVRRSPMTESKDLKIFRLLIFPMEWRCSRLLRLPERYETLFQALLPAKCGKCGKTPKESMLCLFCGQLVCGKETCCVVRRITEMEMHAMWCGAGTGVFLSVQSSMVSVVRGRRICVWGSVYLDSHGEEDKNLKRGKPLFLSKERFDLLEKQWQCGIFDSACKRWAWIHPGILEPHVIPL